MIKTYFTFKKRKRKIFLQICGKINLQVKTYFPYCEIYISYICKSQIEAIYIPNPRHELYLFSDLTIFLLGGEGQFDPPVVFFNITQKVLV